MTSFVVRALLMEGRNDGVGLVQGATEMTWTDDEQVTEALNVDADPPAGLIVHAAGEVDGNRAPSNLWQSEADSDRFHRIDSDAAVIQAMGEEAVAARPPPQESFEVKHLVNPVTRVLPAPRGVLLLECKTTLPFDSLRTPSRSRP